MHPFSLGKEYKRKRLLDFLGSKQGQSGVLWGSREPGCLICTSGGRHGKKAGYSDELLADGSWWYFGQGQDGDQSLQNSANAKLVAGKRSILLFSTREPTGREIVEQEGYGKLYAFRGSFNVLNCEFVVPSDGPRQGNQLLRFHLVPADANNTDLTDDEMVVDRHGSLALLQNLLNAQSKIIVVTKLSLVEYRRRSIQVHRYALLRASGICEGCYFPAPFLTEEKQNYLEVHHLLRLADDGPDIPANVSALCPNCHRRAHYSLDRVEFGRQLCENVLRLEKTICAGSAQATT
jgi:5-methylcytosine-specific restriction protein A